MRWMTAFLATSLIEMDLQSTSFGFQHSFGLRIQSSEFQIDSLLWKVTPEVSGTLLAPEVLVTRHESPSY